MPKAKNRRKNGKVRKYQKPEPKAMVMDKVPHCKHCNTDTRLATPQEIANFKAYDPNFNQPFLFLPECDCWEIPGNSDWMEL